MGAKAARGAAPENTADRTPGRVYASGNRQETAIGERQFHIAYQTKLQRHESDALLQMLYAHLAKPENVVRFNWRTHSIAFWDNHSLRVMHRVTICGEPPA
jgi:alpha-ketoglutarate-dependent taurine dioxygenase